MENIGIGNNNLNTAALVSAEVIKPEIKQDIKPQQINPVKETADKIIEPKTAEEARFEAVRRASEFIASNPFPVSDVRFTIYKSVSAGGDYIYYTRFTSLRDGKVTVVPEQQLFVATMKDAGTILDGVA